MLALKSYVDNVVTQVDTLCDVKRPDPTEAQLHGYVTSICKQLHELSDKAPKNIQTIVSSSFDGHWDYAKNKPLPADKPKDGEKAVPKIDALTTQVIFKVIQEGLFRVKEKAEHEQKQGKTGPKFRNDEIEVYSLPYEQEKQVSRLFQNQSYFLKEIQKVTDTRIEVDNVDITLKGQKDGIAKAKAAIIDITTKGFSAILKDENFVEATIEVNPGALPEILGQKWNNIKAIKAKYNIEVGDLEDRGDRRKKENRPDATTNTLSSSTSEGPKAAKKVPILIGGTKEDVEAAKEVFSSLEHFYHSEVTHPGETHKFVEAAKEDFGKIIGARGKAIQHIQTTFKVRVYVPNKDRAEDHEKVLIVGLPDAVEEAVKHAEKLAAEKKPEAEEKWSGEWEENY